MRLLAFVLMAGTCLAQASSCPHPDGGSYEWSGHSGQFVRVAKVAKIDIRKLQPEVLSDGLIVWYCKDEQGHRFDVVVTNSPPFMATILFNLPLVPKLPVPKDLR